MLNYLLSRRKKKERKKRQQQQKKTSENMQHQLNQPLRHHKSTTRTSSQLTHDQVLLRWILFVSTLTMLSMVTIAALVGSVVTSINQTASSANAILQDVDGTHVVDNVGLLIQDFWKSQYPNIQNAIALGGEMINSANNNNITLIVNSFLSDATRLSGFLSSVINLAANQWVAQYPNGNP
jgi:hypothetical protein